MDLSTPLTVAQLIDWVIRAAMIISIGVALFKLGRLSASWEAKYTWAERNFTELMTNHIPHLQDALNKILRELKHLRHDMTGRAEEDETGG